MVVVGGGAIGLASAWRLAQRGAAVTVVDPDPGGGRVRGGRGDAGPGHRGPHGRGGPAGASTWRRGRGGRRFAAEVEAAAGAPIGYRADGTLVAALDADDRVALDELVARQRAWASTSRPLRGREVRRLEPGLAPGVRAAALAAGERSVDPQALVAALRRAATAAGVGFVAAGVEPGRDGCDGAAA